MGQSENWNLKFIWIEKFFIPYARGSRSFGKSLEIKVFQKYLPIIWFNCYENKYEICNVRQPKKIYVSFIRLYSSARLPFLVAHPTKG